MSRIMLLTQSPVLSRAVSVLVCPDFSFSRAVRHRLFEGVGCWWKQPNRLLGKCFSSSSSAYSLWRQSRRVSCSCVQGALTTNGSRFSSYRHRTVEHGFVSAQIGVHNGTVHQPLSSHLARVKQGSESVRNVRSCSHDGASTMGDDSSFTDCTRNTLAERASLMRARIRVNTSPVVAGSRTSKESHQRSGFGLLWDSSTAQFTCWFSVRTLASSQTWSRAQRLHTVSHHVLQTARSRLTPTRPAVLRSLHIKEQFTLDNASYRQYLESLVQEHEGLADARLKGETVDHDRLMFVESVAATVKEVQSATADVCDLQSILSGEEDRELHSLARADVDNVQQHIEGLQGKLVDLLVGPEPGDKNDIMLEVSAGVGGQEAMLFTGEMFNMYAGYANFKGWTFGVVECEKSDLGGLRRASALITGEDVYKHLKFEAGVHRVQRVPRTERSGRVHTSTMTVAVLPQPSQIDISVNPKDLHIDTFRAGGAGGQHVNKTESAVRITHRPTGTVAECQQERSQIKNRELAMKILLSRLYQKQVEQQETTLRKERKLQVGSAGRSEKIRTYNYSQDRVTDHRGPVTLFGVPTFLRGDEGLEELLQELVMQARLEVLGAVVDRFVEAGQLGGGKRT